MRFTITITITVKNVIVTITITIIPGVVSISLSYIILTLCSWLATPHLEIGCERVNNVVKTALQPPIKCILPCIRGVYALS